MVAEDETLKIICLKTVAVVGLSRDPAKDSHRVATYLKNHGHRIVPINPLAGEILGEKCYKSLLGAPEELQKSIEVVDIFRPSEDVPPIVEQAIQLKQKHGKLRAVWMQLDIVNEQAAKLAKGAGLDVVMNRCMMIEHKRLGAKHEA
ncbi:MAG: CoA-binding protein [Candidatus Hadarchaeota archaeon]